MFVVATPIGNRDDLSVRALATLRGVGIIAAEDTRHSAGLLESHGMSATRLVSLHEHNERERIALLLAELARGVDVALVSDAGTPLVSDPGYRLVAAAHDAGVRVSPVPGPCAAIAALSAAGLPSDRFVFEGFLPATRAARRARLVALRGQRGTLVFYEAPHRILEMLQDAADVFGSERSATLARELTKTFETVRRDTLAVLVDWVAGDPNQQRGELVLLVQGDPEAAAAAQELDINVLLEVLADEVPATVAARIAARLTGRPRRTLYQQLLASSGEEDPAD